MNEQTGGNNRRARPCSFGALVGHGDAIELLIRLIKTGSRSDHVIFHGPNGVGKHTLARLYGQAVQCEQPLENGSPCCNCPPCKNMEAEQTFNYVEFSAAGQNNWDELKGWVKDIDLPSLGGDRGVVVIDEAESLPSDISDMLLKALENPERRVVFIFLTTDLTKLRSAIVSRCKTVRLKPVAWHESIDLLSVLCKTSGLASYESEALEIIAERGGFGPGACTKLFDELASGGISVSRVRNVFGLEWAETMIKCWRALLAGDEALVGVCLLNLSPKNDSQEVLRRIRLFVHELELSFQFGTSAGPHADIAFLHLPRNLTTEIDENIKRELVGRWPSEMKARTGLMDFWASADAREWNGLRRELGRFQVLMNGGAAVSI